MPSGPLVTAAELASLLHSGPSTTPLVLDVRWAMPGTTDGQGAYLADHIPGAVFVDLVRDLSGPRDRDSGTGGRHPMPATGEFAYRLAGPGLDDHRTAVCYDDWNSISAARCWWLLRHFGKEDVRVLDGGLRAWTAAGYEVETGERIVEEGDFEVRRSHAPALNAEQALGYATGGGVLIDARPADRFRGENETVDAVPGHIPGAVSMPAFSLVDQDGRLLPADRLRERFADVGVQEGTPVAAYCGSGVQACHIALALDAAGLGDRTPVYIGSWSDWISDPSRPVELGAGGRPGTVSAS